MSSKLNWLINHTTPGALVVQSWLSDIDISPSLAQKYTKSNWLIKLRSGVYIRPGREPEWQDAVFCLDQQLNIPVHLAGLTSLTLQGKAHYLQLSDEAIWLGIQNKASVPTWFKNFSKQNTKNQQWHFLTNNKIELTESDLIDLEVKGVALKASCTELAAFEVLAAISDFITFEHAAELFQGLTNLSPRKVESLLKRSQSVQGNRLYLFFGNYFNHPWANRIKESEIYLGSGKRQVIQGGRLDKRYQITVPQRFILNNSNG